MQGPAHVFQEEEDDMKKQMTLKVEDLEERIAPSFVFIAETPPDVAGAAPVGGQGGEYESSFGPNSKVLGDTADNKNAWVVHSPRDTNEGDAASAHTPLEFGENF